MTTHEATIALKEQGFTWQEAEEVATRYGGLMVAQQIEWLPARTPNVTDKVRFLRTAIATQMPPPEAKRKAAYVDNAMFVSARALSPERYAAQKVIEAMSDDETTVLMRKAISAIAMDVVGPTKAAAHRAAGTTPSRVEMMAEWRMPERLFPVCLAARMRDVYLREHGAPRPEPSTPYKAPQEDEYPDL